ncbi:class III extradiol dioxygenase subunit B-like domain-containing protein [Dactylosporangium sp. NPDC005555]|uniref:class III extradiol dioxygenase subunit B-like domain-containing protein n=1 Tax=Dactylosporangium sp. NPDC005555 TaxID=3154889 RepID=UPI00339FCCCB
MDVPLVAAAVCPHPPMLVPEVAAGAAGELDELRAACRVAVAHLAGAESLVVVGADTMTVRREPPFGGTLSPWGIDVRVGAATEDPLPLSLLIGAWLVEGDKNLNFGNVQFYSIAADATPDECAALGRSIAGTDTAILIMGDGSACRGEKSPGYDDPRAEGFDTAVAAALAAGDTRALLDLDPALAAELLAAGRAPWQVLAGAGAEHKTTELLHHSAPYGVGYLVASWR